MPALYVALSPKTPCEINYRECLQKYLEDQRVKSVTVPDAMHVDTQDQSSDTAVSKQNTTANESSKSSYRYSIIERLEKRYGGGTLVSIDNNQYAGMSGSKRDTDYDNEEIESDEDARDADDDDLYDSEDSFIDDTELQQNIEELHGHKKVTTKHPGFFVNAGEEIETVERSDLDNAGKHPSVANRKHKKPLKEITNASSKAVRAFIDEWSEAAEEWKPGEAVEKQLQELRDAIQHATPMTKVFPRCLDDKLRAVDKLVVQSHPNKWRVNGYFATLMTFLPFTKQYLKSNMLRLEARDLAREAKTFASRNLEELKALINTVSKATACESKDAIRKGKKDYVLAIELEQSEESIMAAITDNDEIPHKIHKVFCCVDEWVARENEYRQMLKTEDKKLLKAQEHSPLNTRQERNKVFNYIFSVFPEDTIDMQTLRTMNKSVKSKAPKKHQGTKTIKQQNSITATKRKSTETSPAAGIIAKKPARAFKSRIFEQIPHFDITHFNECKVSTNAPLISESNGDTKIISANVSSS